MSPKQGHLERVIFIGITSIEKERRPKLQIREGTEGNSKIIYSYFSMKTYVVTHHLNRLDETVQMMGHNIHFKGVIWKIISKVSFFPLLI